MKNNWCYFDCACNADHWQSFLNDKEAATKHFHAMKCEDKILYDDSFGVLLREGL
jgi:hypothetical protein